MISQSQNYYPVNQRRKDFQFREAAKTSASRYVGLSFSLVVSTAADTSALFHSLQSVGDRPTCNMTCHHVSGLTRLFNDRVYIYVLASRIVKFYWLW